MIREFVLYHLFGSSDSPNPEIPPTEEEDGYDEYELYWENMFENDLAYCDQFSNIKKQYSAKDMCVMIGYLARKEQLDYVDMRNIDVDFIVNHTIYCILRYEIRDEFGQWIKEHIESGITNEDD